MSVGRADVVKLLSGISKNGGPVAAYRVRCSLSAMWVWGPRSGKIDVGNPVVNVPKPGNEAPRARFSLTLNWR